jgi:tetratricopeptide (TPR) repeat protein
MKWTTALLSLMVVLSLMAATPSRSLAQTKQQNDASRALFLEGRDLWDDGKLGDAEKKFREALTKYPKAEQSDRTAYYLITTLIKLGRAADARREIDTFNTNYPQSTWKSDVEEKRISLSGTTSFTLGNALRIEQRLQRNAVVAPPVRGLQTLNEEIARRGERAASVNAVTTAGTNYRVLVSPFNASLESEVLRLILEQDSNRGIELAKERLKTDPSDPAVIANLGTIASSSSPQALPFLVTLTASPASPNARSQAIFWMSRGNGDKSAMAIALIEMLRNSKDKETDTAVADALARLNSAERREAVDKIGEVKSAERLAMLEKIYRNSNNQMLRTQIAQAAAQMPDPKALAFLADVARNDKDTSVRRAAIQALAGRKDADTVKTLEEILKSLPPTTPAAK